MYFLYSLYMSHLALPMLLIDDFGYQIIDTSISNKVSFFLNQIFNYAIIKILCHKLNIYFV